MPKKSCYRYFNANPSKKEIGDCVIRALAIALDKPWLAVLDELYALGRDSFATPTDNTVYQSYLDTRFTRIPVMYTDSKGKKRRHTAASLAKIHPTGIYVLRVAHHLTVLKHGINYDIWDASEKPAYIIWRIADNTQ